MRVNWIKCSDRLPNHNCHVWVRIGGISITATDIFYPGQTRIDFKNNGLFDYAGELATHWAEIEYPEPPEIESE